MLGLNLAVAASGSIVIVSTVTVVRENLSGSQSAVSALLAASGAGTMVAALAVPRFVERSSSRSVMVAGAVVLVTGSLMAVAMAALSPLMNWFAAAIIWATIGAGMSFVLTPVGQVLRRSCTATDRTAVFAAQFSLSHLCWLLTYPIAGWLGTAADLGAAWAVLAALAIGGTAYCLAIWPHDDPVAVDHLHDETAVDIEHLVGAISVGNGQHRHRHPFVIDSEHHHWPR